jgi:hypothetical protein
MNPWMPRAVLLGGLVLLGAGSANAQESLRATIPFDFKVGQVTLPAGQYSLGYEGVHTPSVLAVRSDDGRHSALVLTEPIDTKAPTRGARLVFDREGDTYKLSEIFAPSARVGMEIPAKHPVV